MKRIRKYARSFFSRGKRPPPSRVEAAFDRDFYLAANEDVRQSGMDPWIHFLTHGWQEGRKPHPRFDIGWYLNGNPDVAVGGSNPFEHFVLHGWREGRQPIEGFVCDRAAFLDEDENPGRFNPLDHLVSVNGDYHDWSAKLREVAANDLEEAIRLGSVWKRKSGRDKALPRIRLGELLVKRGDFSDAAEEFEEALALEPGATEPLVLLAECAIRAGDWPPFEEAVNRLEKDDPDIFRVSDLTAPIARLRAFQWLRDGRLLEAWAGFDRLAKAHPEDELVFLGRGLALEGLRSGEESFDDLWRALRINPKLKQARDQLKQLWSEFFNDEASKSGRDFSGLLGDWENDPPSEILERLDRLDSESATSPAVLRMKAHVLLAQGDVEGAIEILTDLSESGALLRETRCMEGRMLVRAGDPFRAMAVLQALLDQDPNDLYLRFRILELGDRIGSRDHLGTYLRSEDSSEMGRALFLADCFVAAAACFEESVAAHRNDADRKEGLSRLASCQLKVGRFLQARENALKALEISPESGEAHAVAGAVCRRFGDHAEAIRHYRLAIDSGPQEPSIYRDLAAELDRSGDRKAAIKMLEDGIQIRKDEPELNRDFKRLDWLNRICHLSESISKTQSADRSSSPKMEEEFVSLLRNFVNADWPVLGRDLTECRACMDGVIHKGENWALHMTYGDLLAIGGNRLDAFGYYQEAHRIAAEEKEFEGVRKILKKIIIVLEQLELFGRCASYLEQYVHGLPTSECQHELRQLARYLSMVGRTADARACWKRLVSC